jgi:hypothetical protein
MWEPSRYFEDFDNAANYVDGRFDPRAAQTLRQVLRQQAEALRAAVQDVRTIAQRHRPGQAGDE